VSYFHRHLRGKGELSHGQVLLGEAGYHLVLHLVDDEEVYEVTGTLLIVGVAPGAGYTLRLADGRQLHCALGERNGMRDFFTVEADGVLVEAGGD
jgi:hypothetical protein